MKMNIARLGTEIMIYVFIISTKLLCTDARSTRNPLFYHYRNTTIRPISGKCLKYGLVLLVTSYVGNIQNRTLLRRELPTPILEKILTMRVFLLAGIPQNETHLTQKQIEEESNNYGDILQGSFIDNYKNLTYKHLMGLQWASSQCFRAGFIIKIDDDMIIDEQLMKSLYYLLVFKTRNIAATNFLMGIPVPNGFPIRAYYSKWYVTWKEYPSFYYPPYLKGVLYITTPITAARLCAEAAYHKYVSVDDVFITGILAKALKFKLKDISRWFDYSFEYYDYEYI